MKTVLILIALQQGLFAIGWAVGGWVLGLSKRAATHWIVSALASALGLAGIVQRGIWPDFLTYVVANLMTMLAFVMMRRGVQVFLRVPVTDRENLALMGVLALVLLLFLPGSSGGQARFAVLSVSALLAWLLLRTAYESHQALRRTGDRMASVIVALPVGLLGALYAVRVVAGILYPELAAQPLHQATQFNAGIGILFMVVGLLLNLVLAYLVVNRLVRRLQRLSQRDPLTGLLNRRALAPLLAREASRLRRYGSTYALLMVDADHFKRINDRHGHSVGDTTLVEVAELLRSAARELDQVARIGGEEFCLLLPHTDLDGALKMGQRVTELMRQASWRQLQEPLTVSVGLAVAVDPGESPEALMKRADAALYRAKAQGRDRVVLAEALPLAGVQAS